MKKSIENIKKEIEVKEKKLKSIKENDFRKFSLEKEIEDLNVHVFDIMDKESGK